MSIRKRPWLLTAGFAVVLGLTVQGSALASATTGAANASTPRVLTISQARHEAAQTSCTAVKSHASALAALGHTRAICFTKPTVTKGRPSRKVRPATSLFCPVNRFEICTNSAGAVQIINLSTGQVVGQLNYTLQQDIVMNPNSLTFAENYNMDFTTGSGNILGMMIGLVVTCGSNCTATTNFTNPVSAFPGGSFGGAISYSDNPVLLVDSTRSTYTLTASGPFIPAVGVSQSQTYRCDTIASFTSGCVNPGYWPIMTTMTQLPTIAANIRTVQSAGPHHYGRMSGGFPLTRNDSLQSANNAAACPPPGAQPANTSCDEYPFASTSQGASASQKPDWNSVWAPVSEQNSQGGFISSFYQGNRVLSGDSFWVQV